MGREQKQAVVLIHGIGEQKPMTTLRSFVKAVLRKPRPGHDAFWSKPDPISDLFELRRLQSRDKPTTHFYEFYWAHHIEGTTWSQLFTWLRTLLLRAPHNVPASARELWVISWSMILILGFSLWQALRDALASGVSLESYWLMFSIALSVGSVLIQRFVLRSLGDAARYLSPTPENVALRQRIRSDGIKLLRQLHAKKKPYDRIIVVGHSLGSVIGYDLITWFWLEHNRTYDVTPRQDALATLLEDGQQPQPFVRRGIHAAGVALNEAPSPASRSAFMDAQILGWQEQRSLGNPWRITDFITIGSPLTHASLLMASSEADFIERKRQREIPMCPPVSDTKGYAFSSDEVIALPRGKKFTPVVLHHAAPFAVTCWTNLYFPTKLGFFGDIIGGPLQREFGQGVLDVPVTWDSWMSHTPISHTAYWKPATAHSTARPPHPRDKRAVIAVRRALNLRFLRRLT